MRPLQHRCAAPDTLWRHEDTEVAGAMPRSRHGSEKLQLSYRACWKLGNLAKRAIPKEVNHAGGRHNGDCPCEFMLDEIHRTLVLNPSAESMLERLGRPVLIQQPRAQA